MTFVGWANYAAILSEPRFWNACAVTFAIYVAMLVLKLPLALLLAVGLVKAGPGKRLYRTALFLPYVLSTTTVAIIWIFLLDPYQGLVNFVLREVGLAQWQQGWLGQSNTALPSVIAGAVWWTIGLYVVLFSAGLASIPQEYYEAARLETESRLSVLWHITIPLLREQIFTAAVLMVGSVLGFMTGFILLLTGGGPSGRTETLGLYSYWTAFRGLEFGRASAISFLALTIVFMIIIWPTVRIARQRLEF
jgi:ABC-type sugar transport system permease subunit